MGLLHSRSRSQRRFKMSECLFGWYFLNHRTFFYETWYGDAASWAKMSCRIIIIIVIIIILLFSRSSSQRGLKIWLFLLHFPLLQLNVVWWYIVIGQSEKKKNYMVLWCIIMSQSFTQKDWFEISRNSLEMILPKSRVQKLNWLSVLSTR